MAHDQSSSETPVLPGNAIAANGMLVAQQLAQSAMRGNLELVGLVSRRARAQMDFQKQAMACRSPADFGQLGGQYWRNAFQDYMSFNHKMMGLWMQGMTAAGQGDVARQAAGLERRFAEPMEKAAEDTVARMTERPAEPWNWSAEPGAEGSRPSSNGLSSSEQRAARAGN
jgi:Phasin protein